MHLTCTQSAFFLLVVTRGHYLFFKRVRIVSQWNKIRIIWVFGAKNKILEFFVIKKVQDTIRLLLLKTFTRWLSLSIFCYFLQWAYGICLLQFHTLSNRWRGCVPVSQTICPYVTPTEKNQCNLLMNLFIYPIMYISLVNSLSTWFNLSVTSIIVGFFLLFHICFWLCHALLHQHSAHSPQQSHLATTRGLWLSAAYSPLCHFRVISMWCRNLRFSSFGPQHIRQDYPQASCSLSPRVSGSSATAHQADRRTAHPTPAAFPGFSSVRCHWESDVKRLEKNHICVSVLRNIPPDGFQN